MRPLKIVLFSVGTIVGFGSAIHSVHGRCARREAFEHHVADLCVEAARHTQSAPNPGSAQSPATGQNPLPKSDPSHPPEGTSPTGAP
jgi:hypothetical protein